MLRSRARSLPIGLLLAMGCHGEGRSAKTAVPPTDDPLGECLSQPVGPPGTPAESPLSHEPFDARITMAETEGKAGKLVTLAAPAITLFVRRDLTVRPGEGASKNCCAEWTRELDLLRHAIFPAERAAFTAVSEGMNGAEPAFALYVLSEPLAVVTAAVERSGAVELERIDRTSVRGTPLAEESARTVIQKSDAAPWTRVHLALARFYCDYGGFAYVDVYLRPFETHTLALAFMSRSNGGGGGGGEIKSTLTWPGALASVILGDEVEVTARSLSVWRALVARLSNASPDRVDDRLIEARGRITTTDTAKWLDVTYVQRLDWARGARHDRIPLVRLAQWSMVGIDPVPQNEVLDAPQIEKWLATRDAPAAQVARVHAADHLAFANEKLATAAFMRAFHVPPQGIEWGDDGEPAFVNDTTEQTGAPITSCEKRDLSLVTGRTWTTLHGCSVSPTTTP